MSTIVIHYGPLADGNGLSLEQGYLEAHHQGVRVAAVPCTGTDLAEVLAEHVPVEIMPELEFACTPPRAETYHIEMLEALVTHEEASGTITPLSGPGQGRPWAWEARRVRWDEPAQEGWDDLWGGASASRWAFRLDPVLTQGDPVMWARLAAALEEILLARELGRPQIVPQRRQVSNTFSALVPPWPDGCPPDLDCLAVA